ncbi:MAG: PQQ-binding-like beta-propeller repeat protein, partial [Planctomycetota bacterium]|nr:PQQ-binding-like beta-propeller repeat protein [Planctomycetota bacterium]
MREMIFHPRDIQAGDSRLYRVGAAPVALLAIFWLFAGPLGTRAEDKPAPPAPPKPPAEDRQKDPFSDPYAQPPDFIGPAVGIMSGGYGQDRDALSKAMELSFEPAFYTLNDLCGYSKPEPRSAALVTKALEKEKQGEYREALEIYQKVINEFPEDLHRVSKYGIFVPVSQYCQRRILRFPAKDLQFYREKHDARAKEAYEQAVAKHSLEGLAEIRDRMMATSYGGRAMVALGDAALDRGHYLEALEYYETVRDFFPDRELHTVELGLKIEYCRRMLRQGGGAGRKEGGGGVLSVDERGRLERLVAEARPEEAAYHSQLASAPNVSADDYTLMPPTDDPLGLKPPVWEDTLPNSQNDFYIYSHPVITKNSVIYRYKNVVYCRSLLTGELRWKNDMGGRVVWQNWMTRQFHQEDVLVQDGLVFTPIYKRGPTLVALDEVTGQIRWAVGPMAASTPEEAKMRFECAPAGGPGAVYAGYILDDIEGETHVDSEYGVIALESKTGRILWRRPICRYRPGLFSAGMAARYRNRIRSFVSPPLYHEGTVYYCTNMGAVAAIDALSGRVRWAMRYPYYAFITDIHDFTRQFGEGGGPVGFTKYLVYAPHPMIWYAQRPLLIGEKLYVLPIDSPFMFCINRRDGKVLWTQGKGAGGRPIPPHNHPVRPGTGGPAHLLGTLKTGELVVTYSSRWHPGPVHLLDPNTGKVVWESDDVAIRDTQPTLKYSYGDCNIRTFCLGSDRWTWQNSARPFITSDDKLYITSCTYWGYPIFGWSSHLTELSLPEKKILQRRRFLSGELLATCSTTIHEDAPKRLKLMEELPHKDERIKQEIRMLEEMTKDTDPENEHGPFLPFSRVTAERYGTRFELRISPRAIGMVYDREAVKRALAGREDPEGLFGRAELALGESRLEEAARLFEKCLARASAQDLDFRAAINQQLYQVHKRLAQAGVRAGDIEREMVNCVGTVSYTHL